MTTERTYHITFEYTSHRPVTEQVETATVQVVPNQTALEVKDVTLNYGETWDQAKGFVSACDKDGNPLTIGKGISVKGDKVDGNKSGIYNVTYTTDDLSATHKTLEKTIAVTVKAKEKDPTPDKPTPDKPTPDDPTPDKPIPDKPSQNDPNQGGTGGSTTPGDATEGTKVIPTRAESSTGINVRKATTVQTGDSSNLILWISLLLLSGSGITAAGIRAKRKKN